jgi:putative DNA primase/helicase
LRGVIILGRPEPGPAIVERIAGALTGQAVDPADEWYPSETVALRGEDGTASTVDADRHPEPLAEAIRWSTCEAEQLQAIGRGRGVRRNASCPLDIVILGNVPLPIKVDILADWHALAFDDAMMAEFGAVPSSAGDAAELTGANREAVKKSRTRSPKPFGKLGTNSYNYFLYEHVPSFGFIRYRRDASRGPASGVTYDTRRILDPVAWLEGLMGPLDVECHHDPTGPGWGAVRCKITGRLNLAFASHGGSLSEEERLAIVPDDCR